MIAAIAGFLARQQTARPMAGCESERSVVGRTPAAIVVQVPAVSIGRMEGAGTTLTLLRRVYDIDMRTCPNCGQGRLEPIATILDPDVIAHILAAMDRFARAPPA
jgi:hypothetical protein